MAIGESPFTMDGILTNAISSTDRPLPRFDPAASGCNVFDRRDATALGLKSFYYFLDGRGLTIVARFFIRALNRAIRIAPSTAPP